MSRILLATSVVCFSVVSLLAQTPADNSAQEPGKLSTEIVVTATKTPEDQVDVPGNVAVVTGKELRQKGAQTLADALLDITGIDAADGSDNGPRVPNIGVWGLKEFDALLVLVDGVPVGGPFNPSLTQIPVEDIERIEVVKGPQSTLYGVSAFAGVIQVFTRGGHDESGHVTVGAGSFGDAHASFGYRMPLGDTSSLRFDGDLRRTDGWQDRTGWNVNRGGLRYDTEWGKNSFDMNLQAYSDEQKWGTPTPFDAGQAVPGFEDPSDNFAVGGARVTHNVLSYSTRFRHGIGTSTLLENVFGATRDRQTYVRSFIHEFDAAGFGAEIIELRPVEDSLSDDLHLIFHPQWHGTHDIVTGAAITWGHTTAAGTGRDFEHEFAEPDFPSVGEVQVGDHRSFNDKRLFAGLYAHDEWRVADRLDLLGGLRYDRTSEKLRATRQEGSSDLVLSRDKASEGALSGDVGALYRAFESDSALLNNLNVYANYKSAFKPAAPNLTEAESATILKPERATSQEIGIKSRFFDRQLAFDASLFHMIFKNIVVSNLGPSGQPQLVNAGKERFQGLESEVRWMPKAMPGFSVSGGYAHHDARFIEFTFLTPDGQLRNVAGKRLELAPRDLFNVRTAFAPEQGLGFFASVRHQSRRPLTRRNTFYTRSFYEYDAGLSYNLPWGMFTLAGRNLGNDRHPATESEIGDSQFYISAPRRFVAEFTYRF